MDLNWWRDTPKTGETDAKWCGTVSLNGHVVDITTGHETEDDVKAWLVGRDGELEVHLAMKGAGLL